MVKFRTVLLGFALALPFAVQGTTIDVNAAGSVQPTTTNVQDGASTQYRCCWVFHMGRWYCIACED